MLSKYDRRDFLKTTGVAALGLTALSSAALAEESGNAAVKPRPAVPRFPKNFYWGVATAATR